jgi:hypothetical protein
MESIIALEILRGDAPSRVTLRSDGTAELRARGQAVREQKIEPHAFLALLERMLAMQFFEQRDVLDRGMTRHAQSFRITLTHDGREHRVHFDGNRFAADLQALANTIQSIAGF